MTDTWVVETIGLRKQFDGVEALRGLDLRVPRGSIFGFLGRNGAGKTTTLKILMGMTRPTAGVARVFGLDVTDAASSLDIRRRSGFVSDDKDLDDSMTVASLVAFTRPFFPRWQPELERQYLRQFDLPIDGRVRTLSRGMRTKLALLLVLCRGAELLVLDEPTSGLDPAVCEEVLQTLVRHVSSGEATVILSSHQIPEIEQVADHVAILDRGRTIVSGALDDLRQDFQRVRLVFDGDAPLTEFRVPGVERVSRDGRVLTVLSSAGADALIREARSLNPISVETMPVTLKDIFLERVGAEE